MSGQIQAPAYAEFAVQSNFSFLHGAASPEQMVGGALELGYTAVGIADRNTVAGVVRGWNMAKTNDAAFHPGSRLVFCDGTPDVLAYPQNRKGWGNLCRLLSQANLREESEKGASHVYRADLLEWGEDISLAVLADPHGDAAQTLPFLEELRQRFRRSVWLAMAPTYHGDHRFRLAQMTALTRHSGLPLMAVNDVLYHRPEFREMQDVVTAIRLNKPVSEIGLERQANAERYLKSPAQMARLFASVPQALLETQRFAATLRFSLSELKHNYPNEPTRDGATAQEELERLTWEGARVRFPDGLSEKTVEILKKELALVGELGYAGYFLTVNDIVRHARKIGILCQGRGSAANSLICYCLRITDIGPDRMETLFERFISKERGEPPDIDVDFEHQRRDEVIAFIYEKYSFRNTALAAAVISYRSRSAMREVGKALGLSEDTISALSASTWKWGDTSLGAREAASAGLAMRDPLTRRFFDYANAIQGFPRHLSQHVGGFVITRDRLDEIVPIMKTAMPERKMIEWDKDDLDSVGLFKVDILALGMLSCLKRCFDLTAQHYPDEKATSLASIPEGEDDVYDMICRADTTGVFQIESRAQMSMLPRLKPRRFYDLVIEVAIVRPGPIQGDMVHPYLRRREGLEEPTYIKPQLEAILGKTLGVPLFQEQAMRIAIECGGFKPDKADKMRRAMATFRRVGIISQLEHELIDGMVKNGYPRDFAERCFRQIEGFGEYGFPESHAASFALLVYASCWFKTFYPDVFCAAILNAQPMGFYAPAQLVRDAREHGVEIREVDINHSDWDCTLEEVRFEPERIAPRHRSMKNVIRSHHAVRLGFRQVKGLKIKELEQLVIRRGTGYDSVRDLWLRSGLPASTIVRLAEADAFRSLGLDRRAALWAARALDAKAAPETLPLFTQANTKLRDFEPETHLPAMPLGEHVIHDYRTLTLSLKAHPVSFLRGPLMRERTLACADLANTRNGRFVSVAGLVLVRQRPGSAKGVIFMSMEDETGLANIIIWQKVFETFRPIVLGARLVRVSGKLQHQGEVIHVVAHRLEDLTPRLADLSEHGPTIDSLASADHVRRPLPQSANGPYSEKRVAKLMRDMPEFKDDIEELAKRSAKVMPRGRNFQ
ncbi:error-prone DNA polymerase [Tianweitania sp. BSSL-BM11]|uniref:Error-prone DNA polymerase n=1 Tax=Tianweitania aestuarii TaxID=2814886 RepID=A0ABS5RX54_9HYPH|nr:error-prone DNA polymerase [Tianweitania aestuarii]MBS9721618.1 error-prone DNA polymerase [Tianweitania aestuarii]